MTHPPCLRLCPAHPGNPRSNIEGESPLAGKGIQSEMLRMSISRRLFLAKADAPTLARKAALAPSRLSSRVNGDPAPRVCGSVTPCGEAALRATQSGGMECAPVG